MYILHTNRYYHRKQNSLQGEIHFGQKQMAVALLCRINCSAGYMLKAVHCAVLRL